jgi:nicotinamide mononucleotide transporter
MPKQAKYVVCGAAGLLLLVSAWQHWLPLSLVESLGFVTGAFCVLLVVDENIANFPLGLANNVFLFLVFLQARLYADMTLQVFFFVLGVQGWWWWLHGGPRRDRLPISRMTRTEWIALPALALVGTWGLALLLARLGDSAPWRDGATAILSLIAQYLLNRKRLEHWSVWIVVDIISIQLYFDRQLHLTSLLYVLFLGLCVVGLRQWRRTLAPPPPAVALEPAA